MDYCTRAASMAILVRHMKPTQRLSSSHRPISQSSIAHPFGLANARAALCCTPPTERLLHRSYACMFLTALQACSSNRQPHDISSQAPALLYFTWHPPYHFSLLLAAAQMIRSTHFLAPAWTRIHDGWMDGRKTGPVL